MEQSGGYASEPPKPSRSRDEALRLIEETQKELKEADAVKGASERLDRVAELVQNMQL